MEGHLEGMLDRDQRTAKLRFFCDNPSEKIYSFHETTVNDSSLNPSSIISHHSCRCPTRTKNSNSSYLTWKKGYIFKTFHRLTNVLIVGVYLTLVTLPSTTSAPTNLNMNDRMNGPRKWINPCGSTPETVHNAGSSSEPLSEKDIEPIVSQADRNLGTIDKLKGKFVKETYNYNSVDSLIDLLKDQPAFLSINLPKKLGEEISEEVLNTLSIDTTLLDSYEFLQKIAVGLEQAKWDQEDGGPLKDDYAHLENEVRSLLCELQMVILAKGLKMRPDIDRDVLDYDERTSQQKGQRILREGKIFREYVNTLEFIKQAFTHLKSKTK